ncbi:hypothetical protein [Paenibacillus alvei]|uniref:hypothetical protein n=1 Tax=Paenibacillus alvei TaxID=44250 RepID=UPI000288A8D7|nr:hypothetical protein [Paenibacillus alvei]EJW14688.1 hypothetical protein PAV_11c00290 [Paenibacillus alvei DSM 29]MCY9704953.1 hypothetical protein [Paenibacillus alvei]MEC0080162.1 hypothetical protein [Paenibacillus alvei]
MAVDSIAQKMREHKDNPVSLMAYTLGLINGIVIESGEGEEAKTLETIKKVYDAYHIVTAETSPDKILN